MINILVTGSNGQLGSEIKQLVSRFPNYNFLFTDSQSLDIVNLDKVDSFIEANNINFIINCAAYTLVDDAEKNIQLAFDVNHLAVKNLAFIAKSKSISLVHISTDYVFDGESKTPYLETDSTKPLSVYGKSKHLGEFEILKINPKKSIIIRTSWVYSRFGKNFVKTMISLSKSKRMISVVNDQFGSPTNAADLAETICLILPKIKNEDAEIFHYCNEGKCSWYEFAKFIFLTMNISNNLIPVESHMFKFEAKRPKNSVLNSEKIIKTFGINIPNWQKSFLKMIELSKI